MEWFLILLALVLVAVGAVYLFMTSGGSESPGAFTKAVFESSRKSGRTEGAADALADPS